MTNFEELRQKSFEDTKKKIKDSISNDNFIINTISAIEDLEKSINLLTGRLREWYALENPEIERKIEDNERMVKHVLENNEAESSMGIKLKDIDEEAIKALAAAISAQIMTKEFMLKYLESTMEKHCKNVLTIAGPTIGAKLLREIGSLKKFASTQSSTVQLLGAEKALFRHIKTGARSPKYGYIVNHPIVANAQKQNKGKAARALADRISICARLDFFKGEFLADKYKKELEEKWKK